MAGKRHHIIPKFLQKGFASRVDGNQVFTWVHRKDAQTFETNLLNSLVEKDFYGRDFEDNADDRITRVESGFSQVVNHLVLGDIKPDQLNRDIAEMISHLSVRTKVLRKKFQELSGKTLEGVKDILTDDETLTNVILKPDGTTFDEIFEDTLSNPTHEMDDALSLLRTLGWQNEDIKNVLRNLTLREFEKEETKGLVKDFLTYIFDQSQANLERSVKTGHNRTLEQNTIPESRVEVYADLSWRVIEVRSPLILGDVVCLFRETSCGEFLLSCEIAKTGQVYLPISSSRLLVGFNDIGTIETSAEVINEAMAACSYEQFICCEKTDETEMLKAKIGRDCFLFADDEVDLGLNLIRTSVDELSRMIEDSD